MSAITDEKVFIGVATVTFGMPTATIVAMFPTATKDQGTVASVGVMITTLFSFVTIPIMTILLGV
jgi:predicted permease